MSNSKYQEAKDNIVNTLARQIDYKNKQLKLDVNEVKENA